ncbi:MAG: glycoside hydrolase family 5 protein [Spirochaetaceae bacterium]|nr:glycoside hydrolase family 5 protein [Spirochaetaceae bacterium]
MDFLQVEGNTVTGANGALTLRGTCVGGWLNMENFIDGFPGCESGIRRVMKEALGEENSRYFFESLLDNFLSEADIAYIAQCGAAVIRLPINYRHFEDDERPFEYKEEGFKRLNKVFDWCEKYGLYAIIDVHAVPGWQNAHWHSDNESAISLFWTHKLFQERLKKLWQEIAVRYRDRPVVAGYELMNEPIVNTPVGDLPFMTADHYKPRWSIMNQVYKDLVDAIRTVDKKHIIFLEGDRYGQSFSGLSAPFAENLVYSCHNYTMAGFGPGEYPGFIKTKGSDEAACNLEYWDRQSQGRLFADTEGAVFAKKYGVPLWVGEFGSQYNTGQDDVPYRLAAMDDQLDVFNEWGASWTTWTYKDMGVMGWLTVNPESEYARLVAPIQQKKSELGAENFVGFHKMPIGKIKNRELAHTIADIAALAGLDRERFVSGLSLLSLTGFAAACLQPAYCERFKKMTKGGIDKVMASFAFENCLINKPYQDILIKRFKEKSAGA